MTRINSIQELTDQANAKAVEVVVGDGQTIVVKGGIAGTAGAASSSAATAATFAPEPVVVEAQQ